MSNLAKAVDSLVAEQQSLQAKLSKVEAAITALRAAGSGTGLRPKRVLSVAARRRIAAAQRARWAKYKAQKKAA